MHHWPVWGTDRVPEMLRKGRDAYRSGWLCGDVLAGLTMWAALVPGPLTYTTIASV